MGPVLDFLEEKVGLKVVAAIGHRIVHGGVRYRQPHWISAELIDVLRALCPLDPDHLPLEISLIDACTDRDPAIPQVQRYGFHGLSYGYVMEEMDRIAGRVS